MRRGRGPTLFEGRALTKRGAHQNAPGFPSAAAPPPGAPADALEQRLAKRRARRQGRPRTRGAATLALGVLRRCHTRLRAGSGRRWRGTTRATEVRAAGRTEAPGHRRRDRLAVRRQSPTRAAGKARRNANTKKKIGPRPGDARIRGGRRAGAGGAPPSPTTRTTRVHDRDGTHSPSAWPAAPPPGACGSPSGFLHNDSGHGPGAGARTLTLTDTPRALAVPRRARPGKQRRDQPVPRRRARRRDSGCRSASSCGDDEWNAAYTTRLIKRIASLIDVSAVMRPGVAHHESVQVARGEDELAYVRKRAREGPPIATQDHSKRRAAYRDTRDPGRESGAGGREPQAESRGARQGGGAGPEAQGADRARRAARTSEHCVRVATLREEG